MKRLLQSILLIASIHCYGQSVDTTKFYLRHYTDQMTDKEYLIGSIGLVCTPDGKIGFKVTPNFDYKKGRAVYSGLSVMSAGLGNCVENSELIFLFEDGSKVNTKSWNDFNCEGNSYFDYSNALLDKLLKPLKSIRFTNGRGYESHTHQVPEEDKNFFIDIKKALNQELIVDKGFIE